VGDEVVVVELDAERAAILTTLEWRTMQVIFVVSAVLLAWAVT
jgi:hypothetical protein